MNGQSTGRHGNNWEMRIQAHVGPEQAGMRLDAYWAWKLADQEVSRNRIRPLIKSSRAQINDRVCTKPAVEVKTGDRLLLDLPRLDAGIRPQAGSVDIVWRDKDLAVVNKPPGLSVHPAPSEQSLTLVHRLVHHFPELDGQDVVRPGIVHRLDKDTSGLLLVALNEQTRSALSRALSTREVDKEYLALVHGHPEREEAWIDLPLLRDEGHKTRMAVHTDHGRSAQTWYKVLRSFDHIPCSLLHVKIVTGRTHQIRVHLAHRGHAVLGDKTYGPQQAAWLARTRPDLATMTARQMLHAWRLGLHHPRTQLWHSYCQPVPKDFLRVLLKAERRPQRVGITGSAGCGKSALTSLVAEDKFPVWSADKVVAELYTPQADGWEMLRRSFGSRFVPDDSGPVDKKALFAAMQSSPGERKAILDLIHPLVEHRWKEFCKQHDQCRMILAEVPLLLEGDWKEKGLVDVAVNVLCPAAIRRQRLADNRGWEPEIIEQMQAWQMSDEEKAVLADINVSNAGSWDELKRTAQGVHRSLLDLRRRKMHDFLDRLQTRGVI
ncbi:MAG: dephospho-CoA kinase [Desulfovermiculus sp.]|nr:dephospho-CoA kinase [Desulfovermiculus sp.]